MGRMMNGNNTGGSLETRGELEGKYTQVRWFESQLQFGVVNGRPDKERVWSEP